MSSIIKLEFEKELNSLKEELLTLNNGVEKTSELSNRNTVLIKNTITKANATNSIDERIQVLASGLQEVVTHSEKYCESLRQNVDKLHDRIEYLSQFSNKIDSWIDEEKKSTSSLEE